MQLLQEPLSFGVYRRNTHQIHQPRPDSPNRRWQSMQQLGKRTERSSRELSLYNQDEIPAFLRFGHSKHRLGTIHAHYST